MLDVTRTLGGSKQKGFERWHSCLCADGRWNFAAVLVLFDQLAVIAAKKRDRRQLCGKSPPTHPSESPKFQVLHSKPTCRDFPLRGSRGSGVQGWGGRGWHCNDLDQSDPKVSNPPSELWFKGMPVSFAELVSRFALDCGGSYYLLWYRFRKMTSAFFFKTHQSAFALSWCWFFFSGVVVALSGVHSQLRANV